MPSSCSKAHTPGPISRRMVLRLEYGATGSASHNGHSESFVIAAWTADGAMAAARALAPAAALRDNAARLLLEPRSHRKDARLIERVSHSGAARAIFGDSTAGAARSTSIAGGASSSCASIARARVRARASQVWK